MHRFRHIGWMAGVAATTMAASAFGDTVPAYYFNGGASYVFDTSSGEGILAVDSSATIFQSTGLPAPLAVITSGPGANVAGSEVVMSMELQPSTVVDTGMFTVAGFVPNPAAPQVALYLGNGSGGTATTPVLVGTLSNMELSGPDGFNAGVLTGDLHPTGGSAFSYFSDPSDVIALNFDLTTNFGATMYGSSFSGQINGEVQSTSAVPLPESAWLLVSGLGALALSRRARERGRTVSSTSEGLSP